ncbi:MAG: MFS transporter [Anaerolineales bacterium]
MTTGSSNPPPMRTFYQILANTLVASVTNFTVWFAITFFVFLETRSVLATGVVAGIYLVTVAVSGFWFGSLVDRYKKKQVMLWSSAGSLLIYAVGFGMYITAPAGDFKDTASLSLWIFVPLLLFGVILGNIRGIALPTVITLLIPEDRRDKANGLSGTAFGISFLITSVISGYLVGLAGMYWVLILAVIMTIACMLHLGTVPIPEAVTLHTGQAPPKLDIRGTWAAIGAISGMFALILFTSFNNFLGGVFMALMDAYGLSLVSVEAWGLLWGVLSVGFIVGGLAIAKWGLGRNPLRVMMGANLLIWAVCSVFSLQASIVPLAVGMFIYICAVPYIEASEHTIIQKLVPPERQGRVFGFAQSVEMAASPLTAFLIGPIAQFVFIPFMTTGSGVQMIGGWFGTGPDRGIALVFTLTGILGVVLTLVALRSKYYRLLSQRYLEGVPEIAEVSTQVAAPSIQHSASSDRN